MCNVSADINECQEDNGGCSQTCVNEEPGYRCLCSEGWFLSGDLKTCFGKLGHNNNSLSIVLL